MIPSIAQEKLITIALNANVFDFWFIQVLGQIDAAVSFYIQDVAKFAAKINGSNFQNFTEFSLNFCPIGLSKFERQYSICLINRLRVASIDF